MSAWAFSTVRSGIRLGAAAAVVILAAGCRMPFFPTARDAGHSKGAGDTQVYLFSSSPDGGFYAAKSIDGAAWETITQTTALPKAWAPYSVEVTARLPDGTSRREVKERSPSIYAAFSVVMFKGAMTLVTTKYSSLQKDFQSRVFTSDDGAAWREVPQRAGKELFPANGALIYAHEGRLYAMGGFDSAEWNYLSDVYVSEDGAAWEKAGAAGLAAADYLAGASNSGIAELKGRLYAFAGSRSNRIFTAQSGQARSGQARSGLEWEEVTQRSGRELPRNTQARHFVFNEMLFVPYFSFRPGGRYMEFYFSRDGERWNRSVSGIPRKLGYGVFILNNRVHVMGGDFEIDSRRSPKTGKRLKPHRWDNRQVWISEDGLNFTARPLRSGALPGWAADSPQFLVTGSPRR